LAKQTICFIINPISGTRNKDSWPEIINQTVDSLRFDVRVFFTEQAGHAFELARWQIKKGVSYIVAVGGDGTVNEVARAVRDTHVVMGIVPCGSGNGLARHLHIPLKLADALKLINDASVISIDYGLVNDKPFFCTFGVGFDAHISHAFASSKKRGFLTYVSIITKKFFSYRSHKYKLKIDGQKSKTKAMMVPLPIRRNMATVDTFRPMPTLPTENWMCVSCARFPNSRHCSLPSSFFAKKLIKATITT